MKEDLKAGQNEMFNHMVENAPLRTLYGFYLEQQNPPMHSLLRKLNEVLL